MTEEQKELNKERARLRTREWYRANRERALAREAEYRRNNPEKVKACYTLSRSKKLEQYKAKCKEWQEDNREKYQASKDKWAKENRDKANASIANWKAANPDKVLEGTRLRRARKAALPGSFTQAEFIELCAKYGNICLCCKLPEKLTADHVIPVKHGGRNSIDNIQPLCQSCNSKKHTKSTDYRIDPTTKEIDAYQEAA